MGDFRDDDYHGGVKPVKMNGTALRVMVDENKAVNLFLDLDGLNKLRLALDSAAQRLNRVRVEAARRTAFLSLKKGGLGVWTLVPDVEYEGENEDA